HLLEPVHAQPADALREERSRDGHDVVEAQRAPLRHPIVRLQHQLGRDPADRPGRGHGEQVNIASKVAAGSEQPLLYSPPAVLRENRQVVDAAELVRLLTARRAELSAELDRLTEPPAGGVNLSFGKRIGDGTTEAVERISSTAAARSIAASIAEVDRALAKMAEGTYGVCD